MRRTAAVLVLAAAAVGPAGCGGGPAAATVSGRVTVDGKPLEKGTISFAPADGVGAPATAEVADGRYEVRTTAGRKAVSISAPVVVGRRKESNAPDAAVVELTEEGLPARYNAATELTLDVQPGGNSKDWAVEGKPRKK